MKKVVVMTTGGTIAMKYDPVTQCSSINAASSK